jgi:hypothetical protein
VGTTRRKPRLHWVIAAAGPTVVDIALPWLGLPGLPNLPRLAAALPAGLAAGALLSLGIADWHDAPVRTRGARGQTACSMEEVDG